jgi:ubiquinone/menaquinone biosynthesis C-methylase UbiE
MFENYPLFLGSGIRPQLFRLNARHDAIIKTNAAWFQGARVLDLASHDGRWSFAALKAGASYVEGIEGRKSLIDKALHNFQEYEINSDSYKFVEGDLNELVYKTPSNSFDVVMCLGYFYHTHNHFDLLKELSRIAPRLILDTVIDEAKRPIIAMHIDGPGLGSAVFDKLCGKPSIPALELMLQECGYEWEYFDWTGRADDDSTKDYRNEIRKTLAAQKAAKV